MAKVFPDGWREFTATGAAERELQTLAQLALRANSAPLLAPRMVL